MHNFYYANTFINFPSIYCWTFLLFTARLLSKYLLWWAIHCTNLSLQEIFLEPYYDIYWIQPRPWEKWAFHTSPIAFGPCSKPEVESRSWLPKYHVGNEKNALDTYPEVWANAKQVQDILKLTNWVHKLNLVPKHY